MHSKPHQPGRSTDDAAVTGDIARQACRPASPMHATAAAPLWRLLSDESAIWLLTPLPPENANQKRRYVQ